MKKIISRIIKTAEIDWCRLRFLDKCDELKGQSEEQRRRLGTSPGFWLNVDGL